MVFHIRRKDREIANANQLKHILKTTSYITIALCNNNEPYLVSLSHGYDKDKNCLYFHCANKGKKLVYLKSNNKVWGQAVQDYTVTDDCNYKYKSVHFTGIVSFIEDINEKKHALQVMIKQLSQKPDEKLKKLNLKTISKTTIGRIDINYISGKKTKK